MKTFDEIVQEVAQEYWIGVFDERKLKEIFNRLPEDTKWDGVYHGWHLYDVTKSVKETTQQCINELWKESKRREDW